MKILESDESAMKYKNGFGQSNAVEGIEEAEDRSWTWALLEITGWAPSYVPTV